MTGMAVARLKPPQLEAVETQVSPKGWLGGKSTGSRKFKSLKHTTKEIDGHRCYRKAG